MPDAVRIRPGPLPLLVFFPVHLRLQHGRARMIFRLVKAAPERGGLDEKIVHEQLSAHINRNDRGRLFQIRHGHRLARLEFSRGARWRPGRREFDAVVKDFTGDCRRCEQSEQQATKRSGHVATVHGELFLRGRAHRVGRTGESRPAGGDVAVACAARIGADPEGIERAVPEVKTESHGLARELRQIRAVLPR